MRNALFLTAGSLFVALGLIGIFIPILPTTPFLLLAAFFYARGSERALHWLLNNRWLGAYIRNYRSGRGIALRDKIFTLSLLWLTILGSTLFLIDTTWMQMLMLLIAAGVTIHILRTRTYDPGLDFERFDEIKVPDPEASLD